MFRHAQLSAHDLRRGPITQLLANLDGLDAQRLWLPALKRFLRKENPWDGKPLFTPFKTVRAGGEFSSAEQMFKVLADEGFTVNRPARGLFAMPEVVFSAESVEYELVLVTPGELGLRGEIHYDSFCNAALSAGLLWVPPKVVPAARRQCREQPWGADDMCFMVRPLGERKEILDLRHCDDAYEERGIIGIGTFDVYGHTLGENFPFICLQSHT